MFIGKGNHCADDLAKFGLSLTGFSFWDVIPLEVQASFSRNKIGLPCNRFVNF